MMSLPLHMRLVCQLMVLVIDWISSQGREGFVCPEDGRVVYWEKSSCVMTNVDVLISSMCHYEAALC